MLTTLDQLIVCDLAIVVGIKNNSNTPILQRLLEMGIIEGAPVEVLGFAPLGDPMRVRVFGYTLAIRKYEASLVEVEKF